MNAQSGEFEVRLNCGSHDVVAPGDVPTLVYMGDEELFLDDARQTAGNIGARFEIIPGRGHAGAFQDLAFVEPIVRSFLEHIFCATPAL